MSTNKINRRTMVAGVLSIGITQAVRAAPIPADTTRLDLKSLWSDLAKEEVVASRALLKLSTCPKESVEFIAEVLKPLKIEKKRVRDLLSDLGSEKEETWKAAVEELEYFDPRLTIDLQTVVDEVTEVVPRARLVALLSWDRTADSLLKQNAPITLSQNREANGEVYYNFRCLGSWWAEHKVERINVGTWGNKRSYWTRAVRAIVLLEHIGTPRALVTLKDLTSGHADAQPTKAAKDAVLRMEKPK
jgi:hypothetical protein